MLRLSETPLAVGALVPQTELGADPRAVRYFGEAVQGLGFAHIAAFDHVLGADADVHLGWNRPYDVDSSFHELFVLFGFLAAVTRVELVASIVVLPQRQAALVAKQAAEIDLLTEGRLRLGVGVGWNEVEFEALGAAFSNRGARLEEQVELMRRLWTEPSLSFEGRYHRVTGAGMRPRPVQRPIPVWVGGRADAALARAGRIADGWFPLEQPGPGLDRAAAIVHDSARVAGRDPAALGMEGRVNLAEGLEGLEERVGAWRDAGATHLSLNTVGAGCRHVDEHVALLADAAARLGLG